MCGCSGDGLSVPATRSRATGRASPSSRQQDRLYIDILLRILPCLLFLLPPSSSSSSYTHHARPDSPCSPARGRCQVQARSRCVPGATGSPKSALQCRCVRFPGFAHACLPTAHAQAPSTRSSTSSARAHTASYVLPSTDRAAARSPSRRSPPLTTPCSACGPSVSSSSSSSSVKQA